METNLDERIRGLAQPLWESAARPYGVALDFWLMAEQMVMEMMSATARLQNKAASPPPPPLSELPDGMPVARVREMAECMWESAGRQYGVAQDFWLSAERHVLAMLRMAAFPTRDEKQAWAAEVASLSPPAYLERIRLMAYSYWETAGHRYGQALDCWLQAERDMLKMMGMATQGAGEPSAPADGISPAGAPKGAAAADLSDPLERPSDGAPPAGAPKGAAPADLPERTAAPRATSQAKVRRSRRAAPKGANARSSAAD